MKIIDYFVKKRLKSALKNNDRQHVFLNYHSIEKVLILFNIEDWESVRMVIKDLQKDEKKVEAWTLIPKSDKRYLDPNFKLSKEVKIVEEAKSISWFKALNKSVIEEFSQLQYDTLLDFTTYSDVALDYLLASNASKFCIGTRELDYGVYDFIILKTSENGIFETYQQIKFYLSNIRQSANIS